MSHFSISQYQSTDNEGAKNLCKIPVSGNIVLSLEREPDYYAGALLQCETPQVYVCRDDEKGQICGLFNVGFRRVFVNGVLKQQRYFSDLRIDPNYQKSRLFYQIIRFSIKNNLISKEKDVAQTIVFTDNAVMQNMILKRTGDKRFPQYHFACRYFTHIVALTKGKNPFKCPPQYHIRKATKNDAHMMQTFFSEQAPKKQGYPYYDYSQMDTPYYKGLNFDNYYLAFEAEKLVGLCAFWHQKDIKQTRIEAYSKLFSFARPFANLFSKWTGGFQLPAAGSVLNYFYIHNILVSNNKPDIFAALLHQIISRF